MAASVQHDDLAADGIRTDDDHPAASEGPLHCGDLGYEGSRNRVGHGLPGLGSAGHEDIETRWNGCFAVPSGSVVAQLALP